MGAGKKHLFALKLLCGGIALSNCAETNPSVRSVERKPPTSSQSQPPPPASSDVKPSVNRKIFIALLGGRGSCDRFPTLTQLKSRALPKDYEEFGKLIQRLEQRLPVKPTYFVSCLPNGSPLKDSFKYFTSADEAKSGNQYPKQSTLDGLQSVLSSFSREATETYLVGHSYGGWSAMKILPPITRLKPINVLMTLDPISAVNCTPLSGFLQFFSKGSGCTEAPTDFRATGLQEIRASTSRWINFYQTANQSLHASAISEATENHKMEFENVAVIPGVLNYQNPHYFVGVESQPWDRLREVILNENGQISD